ncbi:replication initiator [Pseudonocardia sp. T1-2H]|uniref:replication initiator n=1 Tax=Pseudonocardia sp. T1-2H TaxID=3128899 RepID=UPI003100B139
MDDGPAWPARAAGGGALTVPGQCKGKAHKPEHLGIAGRRVLVSRKWSNKSLKDHRAERAAFVRQLLDKAGVRPGYAVDDGPFEWERTRAGTATSPPGRSCSCTRSTNDSTGGPTTTPQ